jgi:beta-lactam-binding protein with PASTA domain
VTFGTADYISPEQARGQPATPRSDIYSLGVTLYEMLTGRLPFTGDNAISVAMQHVGEEPPPPRMYNPRIPPQLEMLVLRALSKDPQDRPATAQEFARLLSGWRDIGEQATVVRPVAPRPAPPPRPALRPVQPMTSTSNRMNLPPVRPAVVVQAPPENRGLGFGGFFLALMLLAGVIGLVYLGTTGFFNDLVNFTPSAVPPPPTAIIEQPTAEAPTVVPLATVPDLAGKTSQEASAAVQTAHLTPREAESRFNDVISAGLVIDQFPPANTSITETSVVTYAVSLGPEAVEVPNVTGLSAASAQSELERAGFQVKVEQEASQTMSEGFVIRSEPRPPARPPHGDTVTIFVSIGNKVVMPDVTGLSEADAKQRISSAGLVWSFSDYQGRDKLGDKFDQLAPGTVVSSIPRGNDLVPRGTPVTLGVRAP